jgi:ribosomal protein S19
MTVTVQAAMAGEMIGVMIGRQVVVVAPSDEMIGVMIGRQVVVVAPSDEMIGVMIGRQAVVVAQQANLPMVIAIKRVWPAVAALKAAVAQTVTIAQAVKVALKGEMIKLVRPAAASQHLVTSQPAAVSRHLAASRTLTNVQILVISQRRKNHHPIAAVTAQNAHHLPRKSALARRGRAAMPPRKAAKAH